MQHELIHPEDIDREYDKYIAVFKSTMKTYLNVTVETILKYTKDFVIAIYLIGSFGRGEGALHVENGHVKPLRDFDILVVTTRPIKSNIVTAMTEEIHKKLGIPSPMKSFLEEFSIWITYALLSDLLKGAPLLKYYELKYASTHLYGIDLRPLINLKLNEISLYNGILILLTKVEGLLTLYPLPGLRSYRHLLNFVYEVLKTYTEIPTIFSLIDKTIYKPRFSERCNSFAKVYKEKAPWLFRLIIDLDRYVLFACKRRKLLTKSFVEHLDLNTIGLHVVETLDKAITLYIVLGYGIKTPLSGFSNSSDEVLDKVGLVTLAGFFNDYLRKVFRIQCKLLAKVLGIGLAPLYLLTSNISFVVRARRNGLPVRLRLIFSTKNHFVRLAYVGLITLKLLVHREENQFNEILRFLEKYLDKDYIKKLNRDGVTTLKLGVVMRLLAGLIRLADASIHRKAF